jgi:hypothetical protein
MGCLDHQCKTESATCKATKVVLSARFAILESWENKMSRSLLLMICILTGLLVLSCAKAPETNRNANEVAPAPAATVSTNRNGNDGATSTAEKIGIEECDIYLTAYDNCISTKVPEANRAQYREAINASRAQWKRMAENPQSRVTLASICKTALNNARVQLKDYNCTF